jgi:hypothetical protein
MYFYSYLITYKYIFPIYTSIFKVCHLHNDNLIRTCTDYGLERNQIKGIIIHFQITVTRFLDSSDTSSSMEESFVKVFQILLVCCYLYIRYEIDKKQRTIQFHADRNENCFVCKEQNLRMNFINGTFNLAEGSEM